MNGRRIEISDDELFAFVLAVADNSLLRETKHQRVDEVVEQIRKWIRDHSHRARRELKAMRTIVFLKACERAGASCRESEGSWLIRGSGRESVRISQSTPQLDGIVAKRYFQKLGLSESKSGIHFDEFQDGADSKQRLIRQFRSVLRRLAHV